MRFLSLHLLRGHLCSPNLPFAELLSCFHGVSTDRFTAAVEETHTGFKPKCTFAGPRRQEQIWTFAFKYRAVADSVVVPGIPEYTQPR